MEDPLLIAIREPGTAAAFFKACATGFAAAIGAASLLLGSHDGGLVSNFFQGMLNNIAGMVVALSLAPALAPFARVLARAADRCGMPRGKSDVLIGALLGSIWLVMDLVSGRMPQGMSFCFLLGGMAGGFAFWRAQGYPGASSGEAAAIEEVTKYVR
jgi:hypothetical protein